MRVASLLPSATEIVCALGARDELVGVSHECDHPSGVERLTVLTRPREALPRGSGAIDRTVREIVRDALGVYEIDLDRLREAQPEVVVTQDLCNVCAVSIEDVRRGLAEISRRDVEVVSLRPKRLADVWEDVRSVGRALSRSERGEALASDLERRVAQIGERAANLGERPSVLTIEWLDPVMIGGMWMPELVALAGGNPLVTEPGQHAPTLPRDELAELDPDIVLIKPCGYDLARTSDELELLGSNLPWERWTAVRTGRVYVADGNAYFNRPGPRLLESLEILAACVHSAAFPEFRRKHAASVRSVTPGLTLEPFFPGYPSQDKRRRGIDRAVVLPCFRRSVRMGQLTKVADLKSLPPGKAACVEFSGEKVALFNVGGTVHAIADTCTHRGGPLSEGEVEGTTVTCPWHGACFDIETGAALGPPAMQGVKRYQVTVKGNDILLSAQ